MSRFYCEARRGTDNWRPIPVHFGAGRFEVDTAAQAEAELRLWSRTPKAKGLEFRVRRGAEPARPKTPEKAAKEQAKVDETLAKRDVAADPKNLRAAIKAAKRSP